MTTIDRAELRFDAEAHLRYGGGGDELANGVLALLDELDQLQAAHRDAISHARRIIAHPDRWIAQDLVDATSNMLSALTGAPTIKGGAMQWKQVADEAEARSKALAEDVAHIDALYEQEQSRIQAVEHLLDKTDSMFVGAISAEHRAILISKVRRALEAP